MDGGAVEHGQRAVGFVHKQADFGAAEYHALRAFVFQTAYHVVKVAGGFGADVVQAQFVKNNAVDFVLFGGGRSYGFHALRTHALSIKTVAHGKARAEQADGGQALPFDGGGSGIDDVQQGDAGRLFDGGGDFVHGVGGEQQKIRAARFQLPRALRQHVSCRRPIAAFLQTDDFFKIHAVEQDFGTAVAAQAAVGLAVDDLVVEHGAFGTHTTDDAYGFHVFS